MTARDEAAIAPLIDQLDQCGGSARTWAHCYITIQALVAFWKAELHGLDFSFATVFVGLSAFGVVLAVIVASIILREHRWQTYFCRRIDQAIAGEPVTFIFADSGAKIDKERIGHIGAKIRLLNRYVMVAWVLPGTGAVYATLVEEGWLAALFN